MLIDPDKVRRHRNERCWTQQQLADACTVSLRTIQRVERTGSLSPDTLQGLCAVFEVDNDSFKLEPKPDQRFGLSPMMIYLAIAMVFGAIIGSLLTLIFLT